MSSTHLSRPGYLQRLLSWFQISHMSAGLIAVLVGSDLEIPAPLPKLFSLYLLLAIGFGKRVRIGVADTATAQFAHATGTDTLAAAVRKIDTLAQGRSEDTFTFCYLKG